jgi:hypothetical protein
MSNDVVTYESDDGFNDVDHGGRLIQGSRLKFNAAASPQWQRSDGGVLAKTYMPGGTLSVIQRWKNQQPVQGETYIKAPGNPLPDIDGLNSNVPAEEWELGIDGKPKPPYQRQDVLYLVNPQTAERFTYATGTYGGAKAIRELKDAIATMRKLRNNRGLMPLVTLGAARMPTKYGERPRPAFGITGWVGDDGKVALTPPVKASAELDDSIPF